jgi:hypothetical protein
MPVNYETVVEGLRHQATDDDAGRRAAAHLLLWHDGWPRRGDFHRLATVLEPDGFVRIAWHQAAQAFEANEFGPMSSSEHSLLDLAIALATDRFRFNIYGAAHAQAVLDAMTMALPQASDAGKVEVTICTDDNRRTTLSVPANQALEYENLPFELPNVIDVHVVEQPGGREFPLWRRYLAGLLGVDLDTPPNHPRTSSQP